MNLPPSILSVLVWSPALGALFSALPGEADEGRLRRRIAVGFAALSLALAAALCVSFDPGASPRELRRWVPPLGLAYDLHLDGLGSVLILWVTLLALVATVAPGSRDRRGTILILLAETALLGLATAGDGVLFLSFYGAGLLAMALLLARAEVMRIFLVFQSAGAALAVVSIGVSYHLARVQTGFPSAEMSRFSSLLAYPDSRGRMFLLGAGVIAFAAPLFPFTTWVRARELTTEARLLVFGGWSFAGTLFFVRAIPPSYVGGEGDRFVMALAALSLLYAGLGSRHSWAPLLVGFQGLVVLGFLSPAVEGVAAGRAAMVQLAVTLSALTLWTDETEDARRPALTSALAVAMTLPPSWLILRQHWGDSPVLIALSGLGLVLSMIHLMRSLPPLSWKRSLLLLPLVAFWAFTFLAPSRFLPAGSNVPSLEEE